MITVDEVKKYVTYNPETGEFIRNITVSHNAQKGDVAGHRAKDGYVYIRINYGNYEAHRLAWFYVYGYFPENQIDHKDQIKHHNWIDNLRETNHSCNGKNRGNPSNNTSSVKGVCRSKNKWAAQLKSNGKRYHLGTYKSFDEAVCARLAGEQCLDWEGCDSLSPAYLYVKKEIQHDTEHTY